MRRYYSGLSALCEIDKWVPNCWINIEQPTMLDLTYLIDELKIPEPFLTDIQDPDERPRVETEDDWQMIIMRIPIKNLDSSVEFSSVPLGLLFKDNLIVSICHYKTEMVADFVAYNMRKGIGFQDKYDLVLKMMLSASVWFLKYLKLLNISIKNSEKELERSIQNKELQTLLHTEKCFVFFITALKGNAILLRRMTNDKFSGKTLDMDLVEDVEIETLQALETANIYSDILSGMMDAYASVIGNNMNQIMKQLTLISIIMMIPTLIASFYGMNVPNSLQDNPYGFVIVFVGALFVSILGVVLFRMRKWL